MYNLKKPTGEKPFDFGTAPIDTERLDSRSQKVYDARRTFPEEEQ